MQRLTKEQAKWLIEKVKNYQLLKVPFAGKIEVPAHVVDCFMQIIKECTEQQPLKGEPLHPFGGLELFSKSES